MPKYIIAAPDSFKGSLTAGQAARAIRAGADKALRAAGLEQAFETKEFPVADGGEGMAEIIGESTGAATIVCDTLDPLLRPLRASYRIKGKTAFIDLAAASGLTLVEPQFRNPLNTSTFGTGLMIRDAIGKGASEIVLGLGGSATNDAALGALQALGLKIFGHGGIRFESPVRGRDLESVADFDCSDMLTGTSGIRLDLACDVNTPFCGKEGAAFIFARQKGASGDEILRLDRAMERIAALIRSRLKADISRTPGSGAAGGAGGGFLAFADGRISDGVELVINATGLDRTLENAALVITGEGSADRQTLMGKAPEGVLRHAAKWKIPVALFAGNISDREMLLSGGFQFVECINPENSDPARCMIPEVAAANLEATAERLLSSDPGILTKFAVGAPI